MSQPVNMSRRGFTIIELMLAMSFVAMLLLAIAMTTMQIGSIYNKGVTLKSVNQVGRDISDELQRTIAGVAPFDETTRYIQQVGGGRLCLGTYSYVWNYGSALADTTGTIPLANVYDKNPQDQIHFAKVSDTGAALCATPYSNVVPRANTVELLTGGDHDLAVQQFVLKETQRDNLANQAIYAITMSIGTNDQQQLLLSGDPTCKAPADGVGDENYCAVNRFDIIARAGNKVGVGGQ